MMRKLETVQSSLREKPQLWVVDSPQTPHVNSHNQDKNILEESCGNVEDLILLNLSSNFLGAKPICNLEPAHRYKEQSLEKRLARLHNPQQLAFNYAGSFLFLFGNKNAYSGRSQPQHMLSVRLCGCTKNCTPPEVFCKQLQTPRFQ
jgi:hypothetical protein